MKNTFLILISLLFLSCTSQTTKKFNLDFERKSAHIPIPKDWINWGDYDAGQDSTVVYSGKFSGKIKSDADGSSFGSMAYSIPANYKGKYITLEGYMKIKNVENGFARLLLRIDGNGMILESDNMESKGIAGTKDWQKYVITLPFPEAAEIIYVAGVMNGKGEAWFDDFVLKIDGNDVQTLTETATLASKVGLDKEFDLDSKVDIPELTKDLTENLELLGKIWGLLKYNHPKIASGHYQWDYELFRILPDYLKVKNNRERDKMLLQWIKKYGDLETCDACKNKSFDPFLQPDLDWFNDFGMNSPLKNKLNETYQKRRQGTHFYIGYGGAGNPDFLNEKMYHEMSYDDEGFKLLALYRYWNSIQYFFPYKHLTDKDWNQVLKEYIPIFIKSKNKLEYEMACISLIASINDTHATTNIGFNNTKNYRGQFYPPVKIDFIEDQLVVTAYSNPEFKEVSKLKVGDVITHINNKTVTVIIDSISPYYPASNKAVQLRNISSDLLRSNHKEIKITYISDQQEKQHHLPLCKKNDVNTRWYNQTNEKAYKFLSPDIGYVTLETITGADIPVIKESFKNTKGIVIDIRNYPSTFAPFLLGSYFVSTTTPFVKFTNCNRNNPGEFKFSAPLEIRADVDTYQGKMVVLVNEETQSQAEYTAMAFRAGDRTTIVGSTTAGTDGNVSSINLPGGLHTYISGIGVYYPDGTETQRVGIIPDVEIKPTIQGIKEGRDELLEKAIEIINENVGGKKNKE